MKILIGQNIKRLRTEKGITQEQLAEIMNVTSAAVSKWEREETYPDMTLLQPLAYYFDVSLDELVGYDKEKINRNIESILEEHYGYSYKDYERSTELIVKAYHDYPNDYRIMHAYMWHTAGGLADNDPKVLLENKDEFISICDKLIAGCSSWEWARLGAWNMKAKILHAEGKTDEALKLYRTKFTNWYQTCGQKCEQLFAKDTPEFMYNLRVNMIQLAEFAADKLVKSYFFNSGIPYETMLRTLEGFGDEMYKYALDFREVYFLVQAHSLFGRLHNDLKNRTQFRCAAVKDIARIMDKFLQVTRTISEWSKTDKALYGALIEHLETDDFLEWTVDYYASETSQRTKELMEDPEYAAVLQKYRK